MSNLIKYFPKRIFGIASIGSGSNSSIKYSANNQSFNGSQLLSLRTMLGLLKPKPAYVLTPSIIYDVRSAPHAQSAAASATSGNF
jgi:hypothetical protein